VEQLFGSYGLHIGILDYQPSPSDVYEEGVRYLFRGKVLADIGQVNGKLCLYWISGKPSLRPK
jgi:hypothetical protein